MAKKKPTKMLAVLGRSRRGGRWSVASQSSVLACLGTCNLDMRRSSVDGETFKMKVTVVLGTATFILPPGATVKPSGLTMLAGSLVDVPETEDKCDLPTLEIEWSTILGRIQVVTRSLDDDEVDEPPVEVAEVGSEPVERPQVVAESGPSADDVDVDADQPSDEPPVDEAVEQPEPAIASAQSDPADDPAVLDLEAVETDTTDRDTTEPESTDPKSTDPETDSTDPDADAGTESGEAPVQALAASEEVERHAEAVEAESGHQRRSEDATDDDPSDRPSDDPTAEATDDQDDTAEDQDEVEQQPTSG